MYYKNQASTELPPLNASRLEEQGVSIRDYVDLLLEGKKTILKTLFTVLFITLIYLVLAPRTYKADGLLRIDKNKALLAAPLRSDTNGASAETESPRAQREVEILRSRSVLGKVVDDLNLVVEYTPAYFPVIGETLARLHNADDGIAEPWWGFNRWAWGGETLKIATFTVPDRLLNKEFTLVALESGRFRLLGPKDEALVDGSIGDTVSINIGETEPVVIKIIELEANPGTHFELSRTTTLAAIETLQKAFTVREVSKDTDILSVELKGRDPEQLAKSVNDIASFYVNATVNWESAEAGQKLAFLESQLPVVKERLEKAEQSLSAYRQTHGAVDIPAEAEILLKQAAEMETLNIQLKQKYEQQNQHLEAAHPDMMATKAQIRRIDAKLGNLEKRIKNLPRTQQHMVSLSRDVQVNTELYTSLLNSAQEQRIAAAGSLGNSRIIDYAVTPEKPYWPKPGLMLAIAGLLGLTAGSALVFLRYSLQRHDNYPALLEYQVGLPLYAAIPHSKKQHRLAKLIGQGKDRQSGILVSQDPLDISVESLRSFRTNLEATLASSESKVIMVGSPAPGMGKSFVSSNLAALLASIKKRVLIIDADMRNGRLHETFSIKNQPGLSDLLAGKASLGDIIVSLPDVGVDFIPRGSMVMNPAELLVMGNLEETLDQLKSFYNHIVIDSPPILAATDAAIISKLADATFLVVKEGRYTAQELEVSFRRFQQVGVKPNGFIINDLKEGSSYYPYYGYAYNRAGEESKSVPLWTAGYQAMGDWFGRNKDPDFLLASGIDENPDEIAEV
ncbi:MAG: polysaccharide biosynthesis tyrosine autokinase [Methylicorpusculum sp.]|uniref:polysaccharide biosynthesis tyrosine autokinase n=1 Tax=Methylicorpusculum sp. TaxID=2713644 RepID=UPI0027216153|nr:polysaccharide biosynthesis tyrosine autokinase [Methylicorpusculum sp.]MDO8939753.1 polysaccharide biosynthesis tyrosine autokinase [Methylicorpusculum sp.]MDP2201893.1 polysaccharide biosynthesis tyrosine autokinase [Methylicorpusculum sp.]